MFEKSFNEMCALEIGAYVKKRDGADYLPWASCKKLLHDNGAEVVMFWPIPGDDGSTLRKSSIEFVDKNGIKNRCYEVLVHIKVDNIEWDINYPVLNGNNPVRDNSMSQLRVHNAVRRAFVKGVAERLGLGFSLWMDDDMPEEDDDDLSKHSLSKCKERIVQLISEKLKTRDMSMAQLCQEIGRDEEEVRGMLSYYGALRKLERDIQALN